MNRLSKTLFLLLPVSLLLLGLLAFFYPRQTTLKDNKTSQSTLCQDCNVILVTMTNLRFDHMSGNGYFRQTTPNLDKLAKDSLVFDNAFSHSSWTLPESISIYTSLYPFQHGVMSRYDGSTLSKSTPTLVDTLKQTGYQTAAFTGGFDYSDTFGLAARFDKYEQCQKKTDSTDLQRVTQRHGPLGTFGEFGCTIPKALEWLKRNYQQKFFLHVQGYDVHCPFSQRGGKTYDPDYQGKIDFKYCLRSLKETEPKVINGQTYWPVYSEKEGSSEVLLSQRDITHLVALYDESITFADVEIGSFLKEIENMGLLDKTIIIFTSEHGDLFGEHGRFMRGGVLHDTFYDEVLHIPLIIKHPQLTAKQIEPLVSQIDLAPTILSFLGLNANLKTEAKDLTPVILRNKPVRSEVFAGAVFTPNVSRPYFGRTQVAVVRNKEWKLIAKTIFEADNPKTTFELYDLLNDKGGNKQFG